MEKKYKHISTKRIIYVDNTLLLGSGDDIEGIIYIKFRRAGEEGVYRVMKYNDLIYYYEKR